MTITSDDLFTNQGTVKTPAKAQEYFPGFYAANKDHIDSGRIVLITEMYAQEVGLFLDLDTLKNIFIDFCN